MPNLKAVASLILSVHLGQPAGAEPRSALFLDLLGRLPPFAFTSEVGAVATVEFAAPGAQSGGGPGVEWSPDWAAHFTEASGALSRSGNPAVSAGDLGFEASAVEGLVTIKPGIASSLLVLLNEAAGRRMASRLFEDKRCSFGGPVDEPPRFDCQTRGASTQTGFDVEILVNAVGSMVVVTPWPGLANAVMAPDPSPVAGLVDTAAVLDLAAWGEGPLARAVVEGQTSELLPPAEPEATAWDTVTLAEIANGDETSTLLILAYEDAQDAAAAAEILSRGWTADCVADSTWRSVTGSDPMMKVLGPKMNMLVLEWREGVGAYDLLREAWANRALPCIGLG